MRRSWGSAMVASLSGMIFGWIIPCVVSIASGPTMTDFFDALETRAPAAREAEQFARVPQALAQAMRAPGWAAQLAGIDPATITSRAALARLPVLRKADL